MPELSKNLSTIGVYLLYNKQINGYQGFLLSLDDHTNITKIELSYHFAWLMNIITKYDLGMGSNDKKILFNSGFAMYVDLIGLETQIGNTRVRNKICTKIIYPLFDGGINRITVSSDLLATSQYINGHKTATIAELQIGPSTNAQINPMEIRDSFDWKHKYFFSTVGKHEQHTPYDFPGDIDLSSDPEYYHNILPNLITSFHCTKSLLSNFFDLVTIHAPTGNNKNVIAMPNDTTHKGMIGEICLNIEMQSVISNQWLIELEISSAPTQYRMKANFAIISNTDTMLASSMQSTSQHIRHMHSINTQTSSKHFFIFLTLTTQKNTFNYKVARNQTICKFEGKRIIKFSVLWKIKINSIIHIWKH